MDYCVIVAVDWNTLCTVRNLIVAVDLNTVHCSMIVAVDWNTLCTEANSIDLF